MTTATLPERFAPSSEEFFSLHMTAYTKAREAYALGAARLPAAKEELAQARDQLKLIEATVIANGGTSEITIDGKNETQRSAQLACALECLPAYQDARKTVRELETHYGQVEADMADASDTMRQSRLALEYATAWQYLRAAAEGSRVERMSR